MQRGEVCGSPAAAAPGAAPAGAATAAPALALTLFPLLHVRPLLRSCWLPVLSLHNRHPLTFSSMSAATGKQLKQSVKFLQSRMLYRRLHSS